MGGISSFESSRRPRLVVRFPPQTGESLRGWLLRLTEANGYPRPSWILSATGLSGVGVSRRALVECLSWLAQCAPSSISPLLNTNYVTVKKREVFGMRPAIPDCALPRYMFHLAPSVCPLCLQERQILLGHWDLKYWRVCPKHGCWMVSSCPSCGEPLSWTRSHIDRCTRAPQCTGHLSEAATTTAPEAARQLALFIGTSAGFRDLPERPHLEKIFGQMSLLECLQLILSVNERPSAVRQREWRCTLDAGSAFETAAQNLHHWPKGFENYLDHLRDPIAAEQHVSVKGELRGIVQRIDGHNSPFTFSARTREILVAAIVSYLDRNGTGAPLLAKRVQKQYQSCWASRREAAIMLNTDWHSLDSLIERGDLKCEIRQAGSRKRYLIHRASIDAYLKSHQNQLVHVNKDEARFINRRDAANLLGVGWRTIDALYSEGLIRATLGRRYLLYEATSLNEIIAVFRRTAVCERPTKVKDRQLLSSLELLRAYPAIGVCRFIRLVVDGGLKPVAIDIRLRGVNQFFFDRDDIRHLAQGETVSHVEAVKILRCGSMDVPRLVLNGFLVDLRDEATRRGTRRQITRASLHQFASRYAPISELAAAARTNSSLLYRRLWNAGIRPIMDASGNSTQSFWIRNECRQTIEVSA